MNLAEIIRYWGKTRPEHPAIIFNDVVQTWAELDAESDALARGLAAQGVTKGDRVGVLMRNRPELALLIVATLKLGAISVPLNFRLLGRELEPILTDADCRVVIAEGDLASLLEPASKNLSFKVFATESAEFSDYALLLEGSGPAPIVEIDEADPAFICYTSGTTGIQKGALLTHRSVVTPGQSQVMTHGISWRDRVLCAAPLVYTGSVICVFMQLVVYPGSTMVLMSEFDPEATMDAMERHQVTAATLVPVIWERMAALPGFGGRKLADFVFAGAGGAPVSPGLLETFRAQGIPLTQVYGLTEVSGLASTLRFQDATLRPGFAGLPIVGTDIRIADSDGNTVAANEVGEILVRGAHLMDSYWNKPAESAGTLVDGWLRTGDLGLQDEEGFLKVVDRSKDMLISGGLNIYPAEIEKVLVTVDGIIDLAVIGVADEQWGEVSMVVFHTASDVATVMAALERAARENLARYKWPRHAVAMPEPLPRTFSGKIIKAALREQFPTAPAGALSIGRRAATIPAP